MPEQSSPTFSITVPCELVYRDGQVYLNPNIKNEQGQTVALNLSKLDSIEELRVVLFGVAQSAISSIGMPSPKGQAPQQPDMAQGAAQTLGEAFQQHKKRTQEQFDELQKTYDASLAALNASG